MQNDLDRETAALQELESQKQDAQDRLEEMDQQKHKLEDMLNEIRIKCQEESQMVMKRGSEGLNSEITAESSPVHITTQVTPNPPAPTTICSAVPLSQTHTSH